MISPVLTHKTQAVHNKKLVDEPLFPLTNTTSPYRDWAITISFYAALHFIESYCKKTTGLPKYFRDHKVRNRFIKNTEDAKIVSMRAEYMALYKISQDLRYKPLFYNRVTVSDVQQYYDWAFKDIPTKLGV